MLQLSFWRVSIVRMIHHRDTEITQRATEFFSVSLCETSVSLW